MDASFFYKPPRRQKWTFVDGGSIRKLAGHSGSAGQFLLKLLIVPLGREVPEAHEVPEAQEVPDAHEVH